MLVLVLVVVVSYLRYEPPDAIARRVMAWFEPDFYGPPAPDAFERWCSFLCQKAEVVAGCRNFPACWAHCMESAERRRAVESAGGPTGDIPKGEER